MLPPLPPDTVRRLAIARDVGRLHLADVDEAELIAAGAPSPARPGLPAFVPEPGELDRAADRLVGRGLAVPEPWAQGQVTPAGDLLIFVALAFDRRTRVGSVSTWLDPEPVPSLRTHQQICVLIDVVHGGLACVASRSIPTPVPPGPLRVALDAVRLDVLVDGITGSVFGPVPDGVQRGAAIVFLDAERTPVISRLRVAPAGEAVLVSPRRARFGPATKSEPIDRGGFAEHLRLRLMAAG
jgi:hypothetical protein